MTNNEKFKEVFGVELIKYTDLCSIAECTGIICSQCPLNGNSEEFREYIKPKKSVKK